MLEDRDLKRDLLALGLLALTVFLAASLLSYEPGDPPSTLVYPEPTETLNVCGRFGAMVSRLLFEAMGLGAFYLLFSLAVADSLLLARREITQPLLRLAGWLLSLVGVTTLVCMALPEFSPGPVIGSGGYLGATGCALLEMHFARTGGYILTLSMILGGLLLCTDYVVIRVLAWTVVVPAQGLSRGMFRAGGALVRSLAGRRAAPAVDEAPVAVRRAGRVAEAVETEPNEADDEEELDETETGDETTVAPLRIRKPRTTQREAVIEDIQPDDVEAEDVDYELPSIDLLLESEEFCFDEHEQDVRQKAKILEKTFANFGFSVRVVEIQTGPVIAQFEVELEAGLRLSKITSLADDLAIALRVPSVRIVAPIPGKNTVGIEVPNADRQLVRLREVMEEGGGRAAKMRIPIFLGKDVAGHPMVVDLSQMPHLLIAGRTGTGKSVCLNSMIVSILMTRRPDEVRLLLIDPKMVELSPYKSLPHLMHPVVTDMRKAEAILGWAVEKMEERYQLLARAGVRHVTAYNQLGREEILDRVQPETDEEAASIPSHMPFIVIIADEIADLMMTAAKEVEGHIIRLAQKSRAVGIHLVLATQKPTVDVITGLIKSNLPARVSFQVASRVDSRVVLDEMGAERLLGNGDLLFLWPGTSTLIRGQGTYLSDDEINAVIDAVATTEPQYVKELVQLPAAGADGQQKGLRTDRDELYEAAIDVVVREGRGSVSLLQRALGIGYGRAARLIDYMAEDGFVGAYNGSQARDVLITLADWEAMTGKTPLPIAERPARTSRIRLAPAATRRPAEATDEDPPWRRTCPEDDLSDSEEDEGSQEDWEGADDEDQEDWDEAEYEEPEEDEEDSPDEDDVEEDVGDEDEEEADTEEPSEEGKTPVRSRRGNEVA